MKQVGRLVMRIEGNYWNAYYATPDTMDGAVLLGSIAMAAVSNDRERKHAFMDLMKGIVGEFLTDATGAPVTWPDPQ